MSNQNIKRTNMKESKKNYCKYCNKTILGSSYKFKAHLYLHNAIKPRYNCKYCSKSYFRYDMYSRHLQTHGCDTGPNNRNLFICDYCDRGYIDKRNLITHMRLHDDSIAPSLTRFKCKACGANYCENRILLNHIRRVHFNPEDNNEPVHVKRNVNESWFEPVVQTDVFVQITKVNNNVFSIKKCEKLKNEKCSDINENVEPKKKKKLKFQETDGYLRSNNYTSYSKAICDYCNKEMLKKSIRNHIRERHLNLRKFQCNFCRRSFSRRYQMADHTCGKVGRKSGGTKAVFKHEEKKNNLN